MADPFDVVMVRAEVRVPVGTDPVMVPGALKGLDCGTRLGLFEFGDVVLDPAPEEGTPGDR